jgi:nitrite reductase/ring-hydroxylating ferredoxin subunit
MFKRLSKGLSVVALAVMLALSSCGSKVAAVEPTWIDATLNGATVSIPMATVQKDTIVHFYVTTADAKESFMAYVYQGNTYVRANICTPCRSINFRLQGNLLVCESCGTTFDAATGKGVSGACRAYPKASATYKLEGGNLVMNTEDLLTAFQDTLSIG